MRTSELRDLPVEDLVRRLDEAKEEYFNLRFQRESGQLEDTNRLRVVRRNIARIYTIMRENEMRQAAQEASNG